MGPLKVGTTLSQKYRVERLLAESGGVILYEATDTSSAQRVWIKILQRDALSNSATLARFQREADGAKVLDVGKSESGLPYMVATELGPDNGPRIPARAPARGVKGTLPGLAPPPETLTSDDEPTPPSSDIPLLDDDAVVADDGASAEEAVVADEPTPAPEPKVIVSPLLATDPSPVLASPLIATPPPPLDDPEPTVPLPTVPLHVPKPKPASNTPTIIIEGRQKKTSPTAMWMASLVVVASLTGIVGWYLGHQETRGAAPPSGPTARAELVTDDKPPPSPAVTATTPATEPAAVTATEPTAASAATQAATTTPASKTQAMTSEGPATVASAPTAPTEAAVAKAPPPAHTAAPARTTPPPTTRKPAAATQPAGGDPLTL